MMLLMGKKMKWFINCSLVKPKYSILIRLKKKKAYFFHFNFYINYRY